MATSMQFSLLNVIGLDDDSGGGKGARSMIQAYHQHSKRLTYIEKNTKKEKTLNGLIVERKDLEALLKPGLGADKFIILFAVSKTDLEDPTITDKDKRRLTTILAPVRNEAILTGGMQNIFEPCPDICESTLLKNYYATFKVPEPSL